MVGFQFRIQNTLAFNSVVEQVSLRKHSLSKQHCSRQLHRVTRSFIAHNIRNGIGAQVIKMDCGLIKGYFEMVCGKGTVFCHSLRNYSLSRLPVDFFKEQFESQKGVLNNIILRHKEKLQHRFTMNKLSQAPKSCYLQLEHRGGGSRVAWAILLQYEKLLNLLELANGIRNYFQIEKKPQISSPSPDRPFSYPKLHIFSFITQQNARSNPHPTHINILSSP